MYYELSSSIDIIKHTITFFQLWNGKMQISISQSLGDIVKGGGCRDAVGKITLVVEGIFHGDALGRPLLLFSGQHFHLADADHELIRLKFVTVEEKKSH